MCPFTVRSPAISLAALSRHLDSSSFGPTFSRLPVTRRLGGSFSPLLESSALGQELPFSCLDPPHASRHRVAAGAGILTSFPSATPSGLALGADLPREDCLYPGTLMLPADGNRTRLFVTYACILSSASSSAPRGCAFAGRRNAPLPPAAQRCGPAASAPCLAPFHCLRRAARPVSCYALFQGMAASEPTSWLSLQLHLISHSAWLWGLGRRSGLFPS